MLDHSDQAALSQLLKVVESTFPVEDAYNRLGNDGSHTPAAVESEMLAELARAFYSSRNESVEDLARRLIMVEPFNNVKDLEAFLREAVSA